MTLIFLVRNMHFCAVLSAVVTRLTAPRFFMSLLSALVFLLFLSAQTLIYSSYIILIVLVCTLFQCMFGYFSYLKYFVSDN